MRDGSSRARTSWPARSRTPGTKPTRRSTGRVGRALDAINSFSRRSGAECCARIALPARLTCRTTSTDVLASELAGLALDCGISKSETPCRSAYGRSHGGWVANATQQAEESGRYGRACTRLAATAYPATEAIRGPGAPRLLPAIIRTRCRVLVEANFQSTGCLQQICQTTAFKPCICVRSPPTDDPNRPEQRCPVLRSRCWASSAATWAAILCPRPRAAVNGTFAGLQTRSVQVRHG